MTPDRWAQVRQIFDGALERAPDDRGAYVGAACAGDAELRGEVESLLASHGASEDFLAEPAANLSRLLNTDSSSDYPEGFRIGPYQLQRCIGHGGMGSVWMAARVDHEFEKKVAIKMVKRGMDSREILRRFRLERQVLAGLDHPNIARLIDGGSTPDGLPYLVMEYVEGTPIDEHCNSRKSTISERLHLFLSVCSAVQYAHQNLVVHRDIKAGNILVTPEGTPKLLDFGIAKLLHSESVETQTWVEQRAMTLEYASPEQVRGDPITTASDVYSLGVLLYALLTGRSPYSGGSSPATRQKAICEEEPRRPSTVVLAGGDASIPQSTQRTEVSAESRDKARKRLKRKLAGDLDMIILKALRKEPQRRYVSVEQFSEDIRRHLAGMPVMARNDTLGYRVAKFAGRHATGVAAVAAIVLALVGSTIVSAYYARQATLERARAERRFDEVRKLAQFVLFKLDPAIQAGATRARKLVIGEALDYLSRLQREAGQDLALQREIMDGYFQVGDVQGNPYHPNLGDTAGAAASYQKGYQIAQAIYRADPTDTTARRDLARASLYLGDLLAFGGDRTEALKKYSEALAQLEALSAVDRHNLRWQQDVMEAAMRVGSVQFQMGDLKAALSSNTRHLQIAEGLQTIEAAGGKPASTATRRAVASAYDHLGEILASTGAREEGLTKHRKSLDIYRELFQADPENPTARRDLIAVQQVMGGALLADGRSSEAIDAYHRALSLLDTQLKEDPQNRQSQRDVTVGLGRLADALVRSGRANAAHPVTERALQMLKPLIDLPAPSEMDLQQYCWLLVTTPFADLRNPPAALRYAQRAVAISKASDPGILDTLARAQAANRDFAGAAETERKALALLPAGSQSDLRKELEDNLTRFRRSAASTANPPPANR